MLLHRSLVHSLRQRSSEVISADETTYASLDHLDVDHRGFRGPFAVLYLHWDGRGTYPAGKSCRMALPAVLELGSFIRPDSHCVVLNRV